MKPESDQGSPPERAVESDIGPLPAVDAALRNRVVALADQLGRRAKIAQADYPPAAGTPCDLIKSRLDQKRKKLQECLEIIDELGQRLEALERIKPPSPNELRVRVLLMQGSIYDFTRLGKASHRERLDHALHRAVQIWETQWDIVVVFGEPEVIEKEAGAWELTPDELWRLGDLYASEGTPALLFADRMLLPDKTLPHSWGRSDRSIACVAESEWLNEAEGLITAHNLAHLLGLDDSEENDQHLMSHDALHLQLSQSEIERLQQRASERAARWSEENAAARQQSEQALELAQGIITRLEKQGDWLWQLYQTCMEGGKDTPAYGMTPVHESAPTSPAWSNLARQVELLSQQVACAEQELAAAKTMLAEIQAHLRELSGR